MKDSYTIHEIAALYGVGPDALRYYERLGLVKPRQGAKTATASTTSTTSTA